MCPTDISASAIFPKKNPVPQKHPASAHAAYPMRARLCVCALLVVMDGIYPLWHKLAVRALRFMLRNFTTENVRNVDRSLHKETSPARGRAWRRRRVCLDGKSPDGTA